MASFLSKEKSLEYLEEILNDPELGPNKHEKYGDTCLTWAVKNGRLDLTRRILGHPQTDVNIMTKNGTSGNRTALMCAAGCLPWTEERETILRELLAFPGIKVNCTDECGRTALTYAATAPSKEAFGILVRDPNVQVNTNYDWGFSCLHDLLANLNRKDSERWEEVVIPKVEMLFTRADFKIFNLEKTLELCTRRVSHVTQPLVELITRFHKDPEATSLEMRVKHGIKI